VCDGASVIAGGPGGAAQAPTGRKGAMPHDHTIPVFDGIVQQLVLFRPVKAHIMMLGESSPAGVGVGAVFLPDPDGLHLPTSYG
jgi:hypothetical protein